MLCRHYFLNTLNKWVLVEKEVRRGGGIKGNGWKKCLVSLVIAAKDVLPQTMGLTETKVEFFLMPCNI